MTTVLNPWFYSEVKLTKYYQSPLYIAPIQHVVSSLSAHSIEPHS